MRRKVFGELVSSPKTRHDDLCRARNQIFSSRVQSTGLPFISKSNPKLLHFLFVDLRHLRFNHFGQNCKLKKAF